VLSPKAIWSAAAVIVAVGVGVAVWLLLAYGSGDTQAANQLDAIKTAGTIVVGTGGAAALMLAARRQRTAEIALKHTEAALRQKDRDQAHQEQVAADTRAHQERVAAATEADAAARRITELYTKAADQLGSDKAPVRLTGFYALERLAQDNPDQRQTIVNVICAYLRMPYTPPRELPADAGIDQLIEHRGLVQERQVRLTAQRLLTTHLSPGDGGPTHPTPTFWHNVDLDLTGAYLINFDLRGCIIGNCSFDWGTFTGHAQFSRATFTSKASFHAATFTGHAWFSRATFTGDVRFTVAAFTRDAWFERATFTGNAQFSLATFACKARFTLATFTGEVQFGLATSDSWFDDAAMSTRTPNSTEAKFADGAAFGGATFDQGVPDEVARFLPGGRRDQAR
jgi:uncharacterized protein YjbI with pentapeptide repeats